MSSSQIDRKGIAASRGIVIGPAYVLRRARLVIPEYRREGVISRLQQQCFDYGAQQGVGSVYTLVIEENTPAMRWLEQRGFKLHRTLVMPGMPVYKEMTVPRDANIRQTRPEDLPAIAALLNETWQVFELYEPASAEALKQFISRTPRYSFSNLLVLQDGGEILACLGYWDWSKIMRITVQALNWKIRMIGLIVRTASIFRPMPGPIKPGDILKQIMLTPIGFKDPAYLSVLLRHVNNLALQMGIEHIFCVCEQNHAILKSMRGFIRVNTKYHLYIKTFQQIGLNADKPVFIDGIDM